MNDKKNRRDKRKEKRNGFHPGIWVRHESGIRYFPKTRRALPRGDIVTEPGLRKRASQFLILDAQYG